MTQNVSRAPDCRRPIVVEPVAGRAFDPVGIERLRVARNQTRQGAGPWT